MPGRCTMHSGWLLSVLLPPCLPLSRLPPVLPRPAELAQLHRRLGSCPQPGSHAHPHSLFFVGSLSFAAHPSGEGSLSSHPPYKT